MHAQHQRFRLLWVFGVIMSDQWHRRSALYPLPISICRPLEVTRQWSKSSWNIQIVLLWQGLFLWHMIVAVHLQTAHGFLTLQEERKLACSFLCQCRPVLENRCDSCNLKPVWKHPGFKREVHQWCKQPWTRTSSSLKNFSWYTISTCGFGSCIYCFKHFEDFINW